jgi:predicted metal-dependent phosphoesterase TrpH
MVARLDVIKIDMHVHTAHSRDSLLSPETVVERCRQKGLGAVVIADHNTTTGALAVRSMAPFPVIVGQEVSTSQGEVIGLFLEAEVARGLSAADTIASIREQGGLAGVPHPFDRFRGETLSRRVLEEMAGELDFVEGFNSRVTLPWDNRRARQFAQGKGLPCSAGSDAHSPDELGRAFVEMAPFEDKEEFLSNLAKGRIVGSLSPFWVHFISVYARLGRRGLTG